MDRTGNPRRERERKMNRALMVAFMLVLFLGVILQIGMMARLSRQNKQTVALEEEIHALELTAENLNLSLSKYENRDRIAAQARQLGMEQPDETQIRVVNIPTLIDSTSTQSADNSGAEGMID